MLCCFKDLILAKNVGITSHKEIFTFIRKNVNYRNNTIFTIKKDNFWLIVSHKDLDLQFAYLQNKFDCFQNNKAPFFSLKDEDKVISFCKNCFIMHLLD